MLQQAARRSLAVLTFLAAASLHCPASAQTEDGQGQQNTAAQSTATSQNLYLEVYINGSSMQMIGNFVALPNGEIATTPDELQQVGIQPENQAINEDGLVILGKLPEASYHIDPQAQRIEFTTRSDQGRAAAIIDAEVKQPREDITPSTTTGAALDYSLFAASNSLFDGDDSLFQGISGNFDSRIFGRYGVVKNAFITGYSNGEFDNFRRLNSSWSYSDPQTLKTWRAGDIVSGSLSWTRSVYLGGLQLQRNFSLRPDLVTLPLPSFSGSAAVPSSVEVFSQNARSYSGTLQSGPFQLVNIPASTGQGQARVVLKDAMGRETVTELPFYSSNMLLRKGLFDYSIEVGAPRRDFGVESNNYDRRIYGSFSARYGVSDRLTLEAHLEGGEDLLNGGIGIALPLGGYGALSLAGAGSTGNHQSGAMLNAAIELGYQNWTFYGRMQRAFADYDDIASVTADKPALSSLSGFVSPRIARATDQASLGIPLQFAGSSLNLAYTRLKYDADNHSQLVSLSYSQPIFKNGSAYLTAFKDLDDNRQYGLFAGLTVSFDQRISSTTGMEAGPDGLQAFTELSRSSDNRDGSYGWHVKAAEGKAQNLSAGAHYRASIGRGEINVQQQDGKTRATGQLDGSIIAAGGDVFLTNHVDDAFAVVNVGVPNVDVSYQNRPVGKTNSRGRAIIADLRSYQHNQISVDPRNLPVDATVAATREIVVPTDRSGVVVDFGVSTSSAPALLSFVDATGAFLPVSTEGRVSGTGEQFVIGYDGQTYIQQLAQTNQVTIDLGNGATCEAQFPYRAKPGSQVVIEKVICQ